MVSLDYIISYYISLEPVNEWAHKSTSPQVHGPTSWYPWFDLLQSPTPYTHMTPEQDKTTHHRQGQVPCVLCNHHHHVAFKWPLCMIGKSYNSCLDRHVECDRRAKPNQAKLNHSIPIQLVSSSSHFCPLAPPNFTSPTLFLTVQSCLYLYLCPWLCP